MTSKELYEEVNKAINVILATGQSYQIGTRKLTRADLKQLIALRDKLSAELEPIVADGLLSDTYVADFGWR